MLRLWRGDLHADLGNWLLGQTAAEPSWFATLSDMHTGKLAILLIFGTGLVAALGGAIAMVIRASQGTPDDSEALSERITALEARIQQLEEQRISQG